MTELWWCLPFSCLSSPLRLRPYWCPTGIVWSPLFSLGNRGGLLQLGLSSVCCVLWSSWNIDALMSWCLLDSKHVQYTSRVAQRIGRTFCSYTRTYQPVTFFYKCTCLPALNYLLSLSITIQCQQTDGHTAYLIYLAKVAVKTIHNIFVLLKVVFNNQATYVSLFPIASMWVYFPNYFSPSGRQIVVVRI